MREREILHLANLWRVHPNDIRNLTLDRFMFLRSITFAYGTDGFFDINGFLGIKKDLSPIKWVKNHKL